MNSATAPIDEGQPQANARAFRRCLGQFATGVTVMTASHAGGRAGMVVNSFAAVSLDPPLVLWSIRRESGNWPVFRDATHFAVNVLAEDQVEVSHRFARSDDGKFDGAAWSAGRTGAPLLAGAIAQMECEVERIDEGGDHFIVVGRVLRYARFGGEPLLFVQGRYAVPQEHPGAVRSPAAAGAPPSAGALDTAEASLMRLLHYASHRMLARYDERLEGERLSVAQFRIYGWLRSQPRTIEQLKHLAYLGGRDAEDAVADLQDRGHVVTDAAGRIELTVLGRERAEAGARSLRAFEAGLLRGVPAADVATFRRVLGELAQRLSPR